MNEDEPTHHPPPNIVLIWPRELIRAWCQVRLTRKTRGVAGRVPAGL